MDALARFAKEKFPHLFYWLYGLKSRRYRSLSARDIFTAKYERDLWHGDESISGPGSSLDNTRVVRQKLPDMLQALGVRRLLDIPCGDYFWMNHMDLPIEQYIGADIVAPLIAENQSKYARSGREFRIIDLLRDPLPTVDLILCRDCLVHFSNSDVLSALHQMKASGSTYMLTTTYPEKRQNIDILTGQWRPVNLQNLPFNLPAPIQLLVEESTEQNGFCSDKSLGLWELERLSL